MKQKKVLFLLPYPLKHAPSQRFRVELFEQFLQQSDIAYKMAPFMDVATWNILYTGGSSLEKVIGILKGFLVRLLTVLFSAYQYDYIFIHREAAPLGPPIFEWFLAKVLRKKIIFDFDDAIWIPNTTQENRIAAWFKAFWKVKLICKWSYKVVGGNEYLCDFAKQVNKNVVLIPTCVDVVHGHNKEKIHQHNHVVIGWTGSHSTLFYLDKILPILQELSAVYEFEFILIANKNPQLKLKNYRFIKWNEATEIDDLIKIDIGLMPLEMDKWSEGKCGFKLIQYMALGIPSIASPVGVNKKIVTDGINGFLAITPEDWRQHLINLLSDFELRKKIGAQGRSLIVEQYSVQANSRKFIELFS